ncbi:M48 family metalloprotease [Tepidimonas taiwanensis]|uniref:Beta-barrel assembly-enhancing protease n=1 Tax=Tepidimonas taiwanensis TaxID=307486 RepID=A0A554XAC8_9BURK|nr:M48 family metalloprotease [Tepidimonas taiwanensis]TSE32791.1 Beta-barrel assembly-enhancing protease [Tepidimonas taiwanensis]UBQ05614.1 M48 family metalloprotease [Tepidimonas taiwanensis]
MRSRPPLTPDPTSDDGAPLRGAALRCSRRHWLAGALRGAFAGATATALLPWLAAQPSPARAATDLPALGDGGELTLSEERRLGDQIARAIYRDPAYLDDAPLADHLNAIWQPLFAAARRRGELADELAERYAWRLLLARDRTVNAFALPGGYLGVHLGLIGVTGSADELASVLAHELSHVTQRHIARLISRQNQQAPLVLAAMILGALAASAARNADIASAAIAGGQALAVQSQLNFSRDMEREADRIGLAVLQAAGFDGQGFLGMFDRLQQSARLNDDGGFPYLRSHPLTTERIADMRARLPLAGAPADRTTPAVPVSATAHAFMAARARVLAEPAPDRLQAHVRAGRGGADAGRRYARALAAAWLRDVDEALAALETVRDAADDAAAGRAADALRLEVLWMLHGEARLPREQREALAPLAQRAAHDGGRAGLLLAAQAAGGLPPPVRDGIGQRLLAWCVAHPDDPGAWGTLARVQHAQGQPVRATRAEGEARLAQLDYAGALDRFRAAQRLAREQGLNDLQELSVLDARARHAETLLREQLAEAQRR